MRLRQLSVLGLAGFPAAATAGGLLLPGAGPISTSRAGAAVVSADDGEAVSINPAGMAKTTGTTITVGASFIGYYMDFHRSGNYDALAAEDRPYEGDRYPKMTNDPDL